VKAEALLALLEPVIESLGMECLGLEFAAHRSSGLLRIYIDVPGRLVTVEDCEQVSREVSATLDVNDPIKTRYTLEVSSPGLDRPLFKPAHFQRFLNEPAKISVRVPIGNRRRFQGAIRRVEPGGVVIDQDGQDVLISFDQIEKARLVPQFEETQGKPRSPSKANQAGKSKPKKTR
jgi:ribosome maturation factor RimP